ncbi:Nucleosome-remodeling factor subunit BPTF [Merluccius polli]|uniref:Nucleosome-remodeling factor subunit BPTF n=1 Tax=Merluccius polli TaxID=89951 RepID=A0AA47NSX3_MERPO|nr:Nucleosome-remodeling factor subunit BPTF [Merluccius polli]
MRGRRGRPPKAPPAGGGGDPLPTPTPPQTQTQSPVAAHGLRPRRTLKTRTPKTRDSGDDEDAERSPRRGETRSRSARGGKRRRGGAAAGRGGRGGGGGRRGGGRGATGGYGRGGGGGGGGAGRGGARRSAASSSTKAVVYDDHESEDEEDDAVSLRSEEEEAVEEEPVSEEEVVDEEEEEDDDEEEALREECLLEEDDEGDDVASHCTESSSHTSTPGRRRPRAPRPRTPILEQKEIPPLVLPESSEDLLIPRTELLSVASVYEVLRSFSGVLRLSPFRFEDFCAALVGGEQCTLIAETHIALLKAILREEDSSNTSFGPADLKDSVNSTLYFVDGMTWAEVVRAYCESDGEYRHVLPWQEGEEFPYGPLRSKVKVLQFLTDQFLTTNVAREELMSEGAVLSDDHCRVCHRLGDLLCCETCSAVYHLECVKLTAVPEDEWQCEICAAHRVAGVTDCVSEMQRSRPYIRAEPVGYDRHERKYWFLNRRIIVEEEGEKEQKEVWYYSSRQQLEELMEVLDQQYWESDLYAALEEVKEEAHAHMDVTDDLTGKARGNNKAYLTAVNEIITVRLKLKQEEQEARSRAAEAEKAKRELESTSARTETLSQPEPEEQGGINGKADSGSEAPPAGEEGSDPYLKPATVPPDPADADPASSQESQAPSGETSQEETDTSGKEEWSSEEKEAKQTQPPAEEQSSGALGRPEEPDLVDRSSQWSFTSKDGSEDGVKLSGGTGSGGPGAADQSLNSNKESSLPPSSPSPSPSASSSSLAKELAGLAELKVNASNLFRLGQEGKYRVYHNQYSTNVLALNKHQHREDHDKRRHLSHKFSLTAAADFKWNGSIHGSRVLTVSTLRLTIIQLESSVPGPFMHPNWAAHRSNWNKAVQMCSKAREFALALAILECAIKPVVMLPVWKESLGHTRLHRMTSMEREEKEKMKKREKKLEDEETLQQATWVKYTFPIKHQVWKQKGEEYRVTGYGGWSWVSKTHIPRFLPRLPGNTNPNYRKELEAKARLEGTSSSGNTQEVKPSTQSAVGEDEKLPPPAVSPPPANTAVEKKEVMSEKEEQQQQEEEDKKTEEKPENKMEVTSSADPKGRRLKAKFNILMLVTTC